MTAKKILGYFEKKSTMTDEALQTDFEFVDPEKWARTQQKIALLEANAKELREKIVDRETELDVKHRVHVKMQHEIDVERTHKETALRDLASLRDEQSNLIRLYTTDKKTLQLVETELEEKRKTVKSLRKEVTDLKGKVEQKQYVIEWFENNHSAGYDQLKEVRKELRVLYKQYFQPKLVSKILPQQPDTRRRSIGYAVNPYAEPLFKVRRVKSANLWRKRDPQTTLGLVLEEDSSTASVQESPSGTTLPKPADGAANPADPALPADQQAGPALNAPEDESMSDQEETTGRRRARRHRREKQVVDPDDPDYEDYQRGVEDRSGSDYSDDEGGNDQEYEEDDRPEDRGREGVEEGQTVKKGRKVKRKGPSKRKDTMQSESTTTRQIAPSIASSVRGRNSHGSVETDALRDSTLSKAGEASSSLEPSQSRLPGRPMPRGGHSKDPSDSQPSVSSRAPHKDSYSQSSQHPSYAEDHPRPRHLYTESIESEDRPGSHYIPSITVEEIYELADNDKMVMTGTDLLWVVVDSNSVGVQYNYLKPELTYGEEGDAMVGADGVKYYMWPLNPNQLYGLSGDVFYHTVMKAFQAMPRVPLSRTGEPHQPPFLLSDTVTGTKVEGEVRVSQTKARAVDHSPNCGVDCKHLKRRGQQHQGKKEALLPIARHELKYERK